MINEELLTYFQTFKNYFSDNYQNYSKNENFDYLKNKEVPENDNLNLNSLRSQLKFLDSSLQQVFNDNKQLEIKYNKLLNIYNLSVKNDSIDLQKANIETIRKLSERLISLTKEVEYFKRKSEENKNYHNFSEEEINQNENYYKKIKKEKDNSISKSKSTTVQFFNTLAARGNSNSNNFQLRKSKNEKEFNKVDLANKSFSKYRNRSKLNQEIRK